MNQIEVFAPGSKVKFIGEDINCLVSQVCLDGEKIKYEVVYWSGNSRNSCWVQDFEICGDTKNKKKIGFR